MISCYTIIRATLCLNVSLWKCLGNQLPVGTEAKWNEHQAALQTMLFLFTSTGRRGNSGARPRTRPAGLEAGEIYLDCLIYLTELFIQSSLNLKHIVTTLDRFRSCSILRYLAAYGVPNSIKYTFKPGICLINTRAKVIQLQKMLLH
jgi:hypothetical protein